MSTTRLSVVTNGRILEVTDQWPWSKRRHERHLISLACFSRLRVYYSTGVQPGISTIFKHIYTLSTNEFEDLADKVEQVSLVLSHFSSSKISQSVQSSLHTSFIKTWSCWLPRKVTSCQHLYHPDRHHQHRHLHDDLTGAKNGKEWGVRVVEPIQQHLGHQSLLGPDQPGTET